LLSIRNINGGQGEMVKNRRKKHHEKQDEGKTQNERKIEERWGKGRKVKREKNEQGEKRGGKGEQEKKV
jgi:hypothetical protein